MGFVAPCRGDRDGGFEGKPFLHGAAVAAWVLVALGLAPTRPAQGATARQGDAIVNVATARSQTDPPLDSGPATVRVRIASVATLTLLQYAPRSPGASPEATAQGAYQNAPAPAGTLLPLPPPRLAGASSPLDLSQNLPLLQTSAYHQGDPVFIRVADSDQNLDRSVRDTVLVTVTDDLTGDLEIIRLTEDGPDTGVFVGYVPTQRTLSLAQARGGGSAALLASTPYDGVLQVAEGSRLLARYTDSFSGDALSAAAVVDPFSLVFDSATGLPLNGASVTVVDVNSGQAATVFSDDGIASFPSTVVSGTSARDGNGRVHTFAPGEFRFPFLRPGSYRFQVDPPAGFSAPSKAADTALQALPGGPFTVISPGSRGEPFVLDPGPAMRVDIPVDPASGALWVQKTASREVAGVGDAVGYEISVTNADKQAPAASVLAVDALPPGFRYRRGSAQRNGSAIADPRTSLDGQVLTFDLGDLPPSGAASVRFLVTVGAGAQVGTVATNVATASSAGGGRSNRAEASVRISDDFFSARSFILGRVSAGECDAKDGVGAEGVPGVRVVLEDGTLSISDGKGMFHFEGLRPGLHVVQLDLDSLPEGYEPVACTRNDRFAGRAFSQFVDVKGQAVWRADFHLRGPARPKPVTPPPPPGETTLELSHQLEGLVASFRVESRGAHAPLEGARIRVSIPENLSYERGSGSIDGGAPVDPAVEGTTLVFPIGDLGAEWTRALTFRARAAKDAHPGSGPVTAAIAGAGGDPVAMASLSVENTLEVARELKSKQVSMVLRPHFPSFGVSLDPGDRKQLDGLALSVQKLSNPRRIVVVGHTDSVPIARRARGIFPDNVALSLARARSVGRYLIQALHLPEEALEVQGKGETEPLDTNGTKAGRATNRRVEVTAFAGSTFEVTVLRSVKARSGPQHAMTHGMAAGGAVTAGTTVQAQTSGATPTGFSGVAAAPGSAPVAAGPPAQQDLAPSPAGAAGALVGPAPASAQPPPLEGFISPVDGELLASRIGAVQVRAASHLVIHLAVDGKEVAATRIGYKSEDHVTKRTTYTFVGVDFGERGPHTLTLTGVDPFGNERLRKTAEVLRTGEIAQIRFLSADDNVADGRTPVRARIELLDEQANPIRGAIRLELREGNLSRLKREGENLTLDESVDRVVQADRDGLVEFAPVTTSGSYRAVLGIGAATVEIETWAKPKMRDWILVGLAEGTAGYNVVTGHMETARDAAVAEDLYADGRVALYAKGQIAGKWLATVAYDSARDPQVGTSLFNQIDPQTYFTLYGDASQQAYDAASSRKIYLKIEREQFYALFGDYDTGLTVTELSRYSRRMNGVKAELQTRNFEVNGFGARTDQTYARDEIPGDGTSGLYHLSHAGLTLNSEVITLLTRDRFRSEVVVEARRLVRFIDYSIDYAAGTLFFREPVPSRDFQLNPVTIVAEYEIAALGREDYTLGGRAGVKLLDQRVRAGVTVVHEGQGGSKNDLYGGDVRVQIARDTRFRGELALTDSRAFGVSSWGSAFLAELAHTSRQLDAKLYLREEQGAFGLGQQAFSEAGTRKWGGDATWHFDERLALSGQAYRQDTFATGAERLFGEGRLNYATKEASAYVGLLDADDRLVDGSRHRSGQLTAGGKLLLLQERLTLGLDYAQSVWGNSSSDFPTRIGLRAEYKLTQTVSLLAANELTFGAGATTNNERLGIRATPWKGGSVTSTVERDLNENDERVFGNIGLRQTLQLSDAWKVDAGLERSQTLRRAGFYQPNPAVPPASGAVSENFTAATAGANYQVKSFVWDSRIEGRTAASGQKWSLLSGLVAELSRGWALSGRGQYLGSRGPGDLHTGSADLRFGAVYRPRRSEWILLNRLDWLFDRASGGGAPQNDAWRVVDNLLANWRPRKELQLALGYGAKYGRAASGGAVFEGYTDEMGAELRYDLTEQWDVGVRASLLHVWGMGEYAWSGGPSVGLSPATNLWLSLGVNLAGYDDRDFTASGYHARGAYLQMRFKFDQQTVRDAAAFLNRQ